jgi:hypothetical protein
MSAQLRAPIPTLQAPSAELVALGNLILGVINQMPNATSSEIDEEFRTQYEHLASEQWNKRIDEETLWLELQIKGALAKRAALTSSTTLTKVLPEETKAVEVVDAEVVAEKDNRFLQIAAGCLNRGELRVLPIEKGGKKPLIKWKGTPFDTANTAEWLKLAESHIQEMGRRFPGANVCVVAKPDEFLFLDIDTTKEFREAYEKFSGEPYPETHTTSGRENRCQEHWQQTDATRAMGNVGQFQIDGIDFSVRQRNLYVLAEGSQHFSGNTYETIVDAAIAPMPNKLVEFIKNLCEKAGKKSEVWTPSVENSSLPLNEASDEKLDGIAASFIKQKAPNGVEMGGHDVFLTALAGALRNAGADLQQIEAILVRDCEEVCLGHGNDFEAMCRNKAKSVSRYPVGKDYSCPIGGKKPGENVVPSAQPKPNAEPAEVIWAEPRLLEDKLSPVLPFRSEFLPTSIRRWVCDVAERIGLPLDFPGLCALSMLSGMCGRRALVYPKRFDKGWAEPLNLSGAIVADSGRKKTPAFTPFTSIALEKQIEKKEAYDEKLKEYGAAKEEWDDLKEAVKKQKDKLNGSVKVKEGPLLQPLLELPDEPLPPNPPIRYIVNDATPEMLHEISKHNPAGLIGFRDELSALFDEMDQDGRELERSLMLEAMTGDRYALIDRIGRVAGGAWMTVALFGGTQPDTVRDFISDPKNISCGFVPRLTLLGWPDFADAEQIDRAEDDKAKQLFRKIARTFMELEDKSVHLHLAADAQTIYDEWRRQLALKIRQQSNPGKASHLSKYEGTLARCAALFQLVDVAALDGTLVAGPQMVDVTHLKTAIDLFEYLESHMHRLYDSARSADEKAEHALVEALKEGRLRSGFTCRDVVRKHWHNLGDKSTVKYALESLEELGWVYERDKISRGPGRPGKCFEVNPNIQKPRT